MNKKILIIPIIAGIIISGGIMYTILIFNEPESIVTNVDSEPISRPPPDEMSSRGDVSATFANAIEGKSMSWIKEPTELPENYTLKEIRANDEVRVGFEVIAVYGDQSMEQSKSTFEENYAEGLVIVYFEDADPIDWEGTIKELIAIKPDARSMTNIDGKLVFKEDSSVDGVNRAYYREGTHTWVAISSIVLVDELEKTLRSTLGNNS